MKGGCCNVREVNILYLTGIETQHNNIYKTKRRNSDLRKDIIVTNVGVEEEGEFPSGKDDMCRGGLFFGGCWGVVAQSVARFESTVDIRSFCSKQ